MVEYRLLQCEEKRFPDFPLETKKAREDVNDLPGLSVSVIYRQLIFR